MAGCRKKPAANASKTSASNNHKKNRLKTKQYIVKKNNKDWCSKVYFNKHWENIHQLCKTWTGVPSSIFPSTANYRGDTHGYQALYPPNYPPSVAMILQDLWFRLPQLLVLVSSQTVWVIRNLLYTPTFAGKHLASWWCKGCDQNMSQHQAAPVINDHLGLFIWLQELLTIPQLTAR